MKNILPLLTLVLVYALPLHAQNQDGGQSHWDATQYATGDNITRQIGGLGYQDIFGNISPGQQPGDLSYNVYWPAAGDAFFACPGKVESGSFGDVAYKLGIRNNPDGSAYLTVDWQVTNANSLHRGKAGSLEIGHIFRNIPNKSFDGKGRENPSNNVASNSDSSGGGSGGSSGGGSVIVGGGAGSISYYSGSGYFPSGSFYSTTTYTVFNSLGQQVGRAIRNDLDGSWIYEGQATSPGQSGLTTAQIKKIVDKYRAEG